MNGLTQLFSRLFLAQPGELPSLHEHYQDSGAETKPSLDPVQQFGSVQVHANCNRKHKPMRSEGTLAACVEMSGCFQFILYGRRAAGLRGGLWD